MLPFIARRFLHLIPTFVGATLMMFLISQLVPGDFFTTKALEPNVRPETIERLRAMYGLDRPVFVQYGRWMGNLFRGDLGLSFSSNQPVVNLIRRPIQNSMVLTITALVLLWLMAIPLGVYSAVRPYSLGDQAVAGMTSTGHENLGCVDQLLDIARHTILPAFAVATAGTAGYTRVLRGQMLEPLGSDFIRTARAKGLGQRVVTYKHALRPAIIPFVAGIGAELPALVGGAGLVEVVISWPGITPRLLDAITRQDIYVALGFLVITTLLLMIGNLISDLLLSLVAPRIRYS